MTLGYSTSDISLRHPTWKDRRTTHHSPLTTDPLNTLLQSPLYFINSLLASYDKHQHNKHNMSGLEVLVIVGGAIYITKKVKENKAKKRLAKEAALAAEHGEATVIEPGAELSVHPRYRNAVQAQAGEEEPLPLYRAPTEKPPVDDADFGGIHLPSYDEFSESQKDKASDGEMDGLSRTNSSHASSSASTPMPSPLPRASSPSHLSPEQPVKKHHRFFRRHSRNSSEPQHE